MCIFTIGGNNFFMDEKTVKKINSGNVQSYSNHTNVFNKAYESKKRVNRYVITLEESQWLELIKEVAGERGEACIELAKYLISKSHSQSAIAAVRLAKELIDQFDSKSCENISVLLNDGWDQSVGALLDCAKSI